MPDPTDEQLNQFIAEKVMEWTISDSKRTSWFDSAGNPTVKVSGWSPTTNIAQAFEAEGKLPQELVGAYAKALGGVVDWPPCHVWYAIHATARQRCLALFRAMQEGEQSP